MQKVLSAELWRAITKRAKKAVHREAAISYVTRDLIGFRKGDVLVVDGSTGAIASGETDAKLLRKLLRKGVHIYHRAALHAKVLLLDDVAVIGSGNMSASSEGTLVEAGLITDQVSTVSAVASFIQQLIQQSTKLDEQRVDELCKIKVVRRGRYTPNPQSGKDRLNVSSLGSRTWLVGIRELSRLPNAREQQKIDFAAQVLRDHLIDEDDELDWIRWDVGSKFSKNCQMGDSIIRIWRSSRSKRPTSVLRIVPVLLKQKTKTWTRFYLPPRSLRKSEMAWGKFQRLLKSLGYPRRLGPGIVHLVEPDVADAISRQWSKFAK